MISLIYIFHIVIVYVIFFLILVKTVANIILGRSSKMYIQNRMTYIYHDFYYLYDFCISLWLMILIIYQVWLIFRQSLLFSKFWIFLCMMGGEGGTWGSSWLYFDGFEWKCLYLLF